MTSGTIHVTTTPAPPGSRPLHRQQLPPVVGLSLAFAELYAEGIAPAWWEMLVEKRNELAEARARVVHLERAVKESAVDLEVTLNALRLLFGGVRNDMVARGGPPEWSPLSAMGLAESTLARLHSA